MSYNPNKGLLTINQGNSALGEYKVSSKYLKADSYNVLYSVTDLDSGRNASGTLDRTALAHRIPKIEFNTPAMLTNVDMGEFLREISNRYTVANERKVSATFYVPEIDDYVTSDMYFPDMTFPIYSINTGKIQYDSIRFALIGY